MARVHLRGVRYRVRDAAVRSAIESFASDPIPDLRGFVERISAGERLAVRVEDAEAAYELASELISLGVNAEPDEMDD